MARFLAKANTPRDAVLAARDAGHDVAWIVEVQPGPRDDVVLARALQEDRVLITFAKEPPLARTLSRGGARTSLPGPFQALSHAG